MRKESSPPPDAAFTHLKIDCAAASKCKSHSGEGDHRRYCANEKRSAKRRQNLSSSVSLTVPMADVVGCQPQEGASLSLKVQQPLKLNSGSDSSEVVVYVVDFLAVEEAKSFVQLLNLCAAECAE